MRPPESRFSMLPLNAVYIFGQVAFLTGGSKASESHGLACHDASLRTSVRAVHFEGACRSSTLQICNRTADSGKESPADRDSSPNFPRWVELTNLFGCEPSYTKWVHFKTFGLLGARVGLRVA